MNVKAIRNARDIEFKCSTCGRSVDVARVDVFVGLDVPRIHIEPCVYCGENVAAGTRAQCSSGAK